MTFHFVDCSAKCNVLLSVLLAYFLLHACLFGVFFPLTRAFSHVFWVAYLFTTQAHICLRTCPTAILQASMTTANKQAKRRLEIQPRHVANVELVNRRDYRRKEIVAGWYSGERGGVSVKLLVNMQANVCGAGFSRSRCERYPNFYTDLSNTMWKIIETLILALFSSSPSYLYVLSGSFSK